MINKKGSELDSAILGFPSFIAIVIIMVLFMGGVLVVKFLKSPEKPQESNFFLSKDYSLLLSQISVTDKRGVKNDMLVIEAIVAVQNGEVELESLRESLYQLLPEDQIENCILLEVVSDSGEKSRLVVHRTNFEDSFIIALGKRKKYQRVNIKIDEMNFKLDFYSGRCL